MMKRPKKQQNDKNLQHQRGLSDNEEPFKEQTAHCTREPQGDTFANFTRHIERTDQRPCLTSVPRGIPGTTLPPLGKAVRFPTPALPLGAAITPAHSFGSTSAVSLIGHGPALPILTPYESEQQTHLALQILLLQRQEEQQASRAAQAVATAHSYVARQVETAIVARAQLERASAQLLSQAISPLDCKGSTSYQSAASLRPQAASLHHQKPSVSNQDDKGRQQFKLPSFFDASSFPDPSSDGDRSDEDSDESKHGHVTESFPIKLYRILEEAEDNGDDHIVSFFQHGKAFVIHKPLEFVNDLMPKYFATTRYSSFQRQLNIYGFRRINRGLEKGGYFHEYFIRGRKNLCKKIARKKSPDTAQEATSTGVHGDSSAALLTRDSNLDAATGFARPDVVQLSQHITSMHHATRSAPSSTVPFSNIAPQGILQAPMELGPICAASFTLPTHTLQGFASELGRPLLPATAAVSLIAEAQRIPSVVAALDRRQSELGSRWLQVQQHNTFLSKKRSRKKDIRLIQVRFPE